ncbi:unannotated protein [freshwater metagenome]|uniref:Unannotated protein n=1 Tax=freshwater metagenome TaxID=449393 RepID=A0A6J7UCI1_9ZZZZ
MLGSSSGERKWSEFPKRSAPSRAPRFPTLGRQDGARVEGRNHRGQCSSPHDRSANLCGPAQSHTARRSMGRRGSHSNSWLSENLATDCSHRRSGPGFLRVYRRSWGTRCLGAISVSLLWPILGENSCDCSVCVAHRRYWRSICHRAWSSGLIRGPRNMVGNRYRTSVFQPGGSHSHSWGRPQRRGLKPRGCCADARSLPFSSCSTRASTDGAPSHCRLRRGGVLVLLHKLWRDRDARWWLSYHRRSRDLDSSNSAV